MIRAIKKILDPVSRKLSQVVSRGVLTLVNDALKMQECQIKIMADETLDGVERFQQYGMTSVPLAGAECINLSVNANRSHSVVICIDDRRYRLKALPDGAVALYTYEDNHKIVLSEGRLIDVYCDKMTIHADTNMTINTPQLNVTAATGVLMTTPAVTVPSGDVVATGISLVDHVHPENDNGGPTGAPQ